MNSRDKGARGERELANLLKKAGFNTRRGQQFSGLYGDADVVGLDGIHIECKRVESLNIYKAYFQSVRDSKNNELPAVFHRKNNQPWLVTIGLYDFIEIYKRWRDDISTD